MHWKTAIEKGAPHFEKLGLANLVIGGTHALRLHGLYLPRPIGDFDVIIYEPTEEQLDYLYDLVSSRKATATDESTDTSYDQRSYKIEDPEEPIDFLLEFDTPLPEELLQISHNGITMYVQSVSNIIKAKSAYQEKKGERRQKDIDDCLTLKNMNFNL